MAAAWLSPFVRLPIENEWERGCGVEYVIETQRLSKYYGPKCVVDSLDLRIPRGTVYGFLGRNGAGKSTTIKMLLGMVHPTRGAAFVLGEDAAELSPNTRSRIAYLAEGHPIYRWMTIRDAMNFTRAFYPQWNQTLLDQMLGHFELSPRQKIRKLSNGQRAQVSLALAVAPDPELLILDDPTIGLDTVVRRDFLESLIQIIQRQGRTILFSSHILSDVERVANRIGILVDGVLRVDCPTEHFKQTVRKIVLGFAHEPPEFPACQGIGLYTSNQCRGVEQRGWRDGEVASNRIRHDRANPVSEAEH